MIEETVVEYKDDEIVISLEYFENTGCIHESCNEYTVSFFIVPSANGETFIGISSFIRAFKIIIKAYLKHKYINSRR